MAADFTDDEVAIVTYNLDPDFKEYVEKYCRKHRVSKDEAMTHAIVKLYGEYNEERLKSSRKSSTV